MVGVLHASDGDGVVDIEDGKWTLGNAGDSKAIHRHGNILRFSVDDNVVPLVVVKKRTANH